MMNRMKKLLLFTLVLTILLSIGTLPVFADVILEPRDAFFAAHEDECEYTTPRKYIVNSQVGHAYAYTNPESIISVKGLPNGTEVILSWIYTDKSGETWGTHYNAEGGWYRLSDLSVVYDTFSFLEEHKDEVVDYQKGTYTFDGSETTPIVVWNYPGSKSASTFSHGSVEESVRQTYTDPNGNVWGYIAYHVGFRNVWICMTDPYGEKADEMAESLISVVLKADPTNPDQIPALKAEPTPIDKIPMADGNKQILIVIGVLVGVLVLATSVLIPVLFIKKKKT